MANDDQHPRGWTVHGWLDWLHERAPNYLKRNANRYLSRDPAQAALADADRKKLEREFNTELIRREKERGIRGKQ